MSDTVIDKSWTEEYAQALKYPPTPGTVLRTVDDSRALVRVELETGKQPFVYACVYCHNVVGGPVGWFLQPLALCEKQFGWKCILMPRAREQLFALRGMAPILAVQEITILNMSRSRQSFLCEVTKW